MPLIDGLQVAHACLLGDAKPSKLITQNLNVMAQALLDTTGAGGGESGAKIFFGAPDAGWRRLVGSGSGGGSSAVTGVEIGEARLVWLTEQVSSVLGLLKIF